MRFSGIQFVFKALLVFQLTATSTEQSSQTIIPEVPVKTCQDTSQPIVHTRVGPIRGLCADDGAYSMFMGIPYAKVDPDNAFGPAIPQSIFEDVFNAYNDSAICPQIEEYNYTIVGTLDCLHLNIYIPNSASTENRLPVMVYIFGGMFSLGFAGRFIYGPSFIVRHDVILVTLNYRLGPYGFMCLDIPEAPGNQGLKDQVKALRWIKENILSFGGDNSRVTLVGSSAGAIATDLHWYFDPEPPFQRLILQSGVALYNSVAKNPMAPFKLAELLNYTTNDIKDALWFLNAADPHQLIFAANLSGLTFGPCIEKQFSNVDNFITKHPVSVETRRVQDVDILMGFNDDEAYSKFTTLDNSTFHSKDRLQHVIDAFFDFKGENKLRGDIIQFIRHFYLGDDKQDAENRRPVIDLISDFIFCHPMLRAVQKHLNNGVENLYLYLFSYSGGRNYIKDKENVTTGGAAHADELGYLFDISYMKKPLRANDKLIMERMTELWTNFIKYGNPTPRATELVPLPWPKVTKEKLHYLQIDTQLHVDTRPMRERMSFLDLVFKTNEQYQIGFERSVSSADKHVFVVISSPLSYAIVYIVLCNY